MKVSPFFFPPARCDWRTWGYAYKPVRSRRLFRSLRRRPCVATPVLLCAGRGWGNRVMSGRNRNAFCAVRPPGHHAGPRGLVTCGNDAQGSHGFCLLNNVVSAPASRAVVVGCPPERWGGGRRGVGFAFGAAAGLDCHRLGGPE